MALNIKNAEAEAAIRQLAARTGETLTEALTRAVQERLERVERETSREQRIAAVRRITAEMRALIGDDPVDVDSLYDPETGLPA